MRNLYLTYDVRRRPSFWSKPESVWLLGFLVLTPLFVFFRHEKLLEIARAKAQEIPVLRKELSLKNEEIQSLSVKVQAENASNKQIWLSDSQVRQIVSILMPQKKDQDHFMAILGCENSNHDPKRVHVNGPGLGYDLGIAQINSTFHANRVREFFGEDFNSAMTDPVKNLVYAAYLYQHSGPSAWVCNKLVQ